MDLVMWFVLFLVCNLGISALGESISRVWRHTSQLVSMLIQLNIIRMKMEFNLKVQNDITLAWLMLIGNISCMLSIRKFYVRWYDFKNHPVRFAIVVLCFVPTIAFSLVYVLMAHEALQLL